MKSGTVTIKDIARELGISPSTVSRALKDHPDISPETKRLVNELARELNYQPNSIALSLRSSKTNTLGVIVPEIVHFFFSTVISGIEEVAYSAGYNVIICQTNESYHREVTDVNAMLFSRVDGIIASISAETTQFDHFRKLQERGIPIVFFDRYTDEIQSSRVIVDDYLGAFQAVDHLIKQGCARIVHLEGPPHLKISQDRLNGYKEALASNGMTFDSDMVVRADTQSQAYDTTMKLLSESNRPDGIFGHSDLVAFGAMQAIKSLGLSIPGDVAVMGFSNWQFSSFTEPALSTVSQPGYEMGMIATELLLDEMSSTSGFDFITRKLKAELTVRESSEKKTLKQLTV